MSAALLCARCSQESNPTTIWRCVSLNNALLAVCVFRVADEYYFSQDAMFDVRGKLTGEIHWKFLNNKSTKIKHILCSATEHGNGARWLQQDLCLQFRIGEKKKSQFVLKFYILNIGQGRHGREDLLQDGHASFEHWHQGGDGLHCQHLQRYEYFIHMIKNNIIR